MLRLNATILNDMDTPRAPSPAPTMQYPMGQWMAPLHQDQRLWRLQTGMVAVWHQEAGEWRLMRLALPGDWLNIEAASRPSLATEMLALSDCRLLGQAPVEAAQTPQWLQQVLHQQQARAETALHLRTGTAQERLVYFMSLLQSIRAAERPPEPLETPPLPALRWLAPLLDTAPETICRTLTKLRRQTTTAPQPRPAQQVSLHVVA